MLCAHATNATCYHHEADLYISLNKITLQNRTEVKLLNTVVKNLKVRVEGVAVSHVQPVTSLSQLMRMVTIEEKFDMLRLL